MFNKGYGAVVFQLCGRLKMPVALHRDYLFVSLTGNRTHYLITEGHLITNEAHAIKLKDYETYFSLSFS